MMKRRGLQILMILVLICTLGISACKKDVGTPEDNAVTEPEEETGGDTGSYALIGVAALVFIAGAYYFKVYKPRHEEGEYDDEGMEFDDSEDETDDGE